MEWSKHEIRNCEEKFGGSHYRAEIRLGQGLGHYENLPMQHTEIFSTIKKWKFHQKNFDVFYICAQNIDRGYTLEPPRRGGSNEHPQSMFGQKIRKIGIPLHTPFLLYQSGVFIARTSFPDEDISIIALHWKPIHTRTCSYIRNKFACTRLLAQISWWNFKDRKTQTSSVNIVYNYW